MFLRPTNLFRLSTNASHAFHLRTKKENSPQPISDDAKSPRPIKIEENFKTKDFQVPRNSYPIRLPDSYVVTDDSKTKDFSTDESEMLQCVIDSGATNHIFNVDRSYFRNYKECTTNIHTASKVSTITAIGIGDLHIVTYKNNRSQGIIESSKRPSLSKFWTKPAFALQTY